ncbi:MAG: LuxR C-terminal-related transcriptional regulator [Cyclobacteriaceae bacterium]|nr:LuxR C-terminal-related transcriptional regulator [Cyclobacteriaceae bacterium]
MSQNTVSTHRKNMMSKLEATNMVDLVLKPEICNRNSINLSST